MGGVIQDDIVSTVVGEPRSMLMALGAVPSSGPGEDRKM